MIRQHIMIVTKHLLDRPHGTIEEHEGYLEKLACLYLINPRLSHRPNSLLNTPPARLFAIPPEYIALEAKFEA